MRQHKTAQDRNHERVRALGQKFLDPRLKPAMECEFRPKDFALAKDQEEQPNRNSQNGHCQVIAIRMRSERGHKVLFLQPRAWRASQLCFRNPGTSTGLVPLRSRGQIGPGRCPEVLAHSCSCTSRHFALKSTWANMSLPLNICCPPPTPNRRRLKSFWRWSRARTTRF